MNLWNPEQNAATQHASAELSFALASKAFESFQKVVDLNLKTARSGIAETQAAVLDAFSGKSPQEWVALQEGVAERAAPRIQSY
jgi:hypothetical protein